MDILSLGNEHFRKYPIVAGFWISFPEKSRHLQIKKTLDPRMLETEDERTSRIQRMTRERLESALSPREPSPTGDADEIVFRSIEGFDPGPVELEDAASSD
jgi:hypothetical protein